MKYSKILSHGAFLVMLLFALIGCSLYQITSEELTSDYYPAKPSSEKVQYLENVARSYQVIGKVTVNAERIQSRKMLDIIEKMKFEAAQLGGDAITNIAANTGTGTWARIKPKLFDNANLRTNFTADVIIFK